MGRLVSRARQCAAAAVALACGCAGPGPHAALRSPAPRAPASSSAKSTADPLPSTGDARLDAALADPSQRLTAIRGLLQQLRAANEADGWKAGANTAALIARIVPPLTKICVSTDPDDYVRPAVVSLLASAGDRRAWPCFQAALSDFEPGYGEAEARTACRAISSQRATETRAVLLESFLRLRASQVDLAPLPGELRQAMLVVADPAWVPQLIARIGRPIVDRRDAPALKDELFWQMTSADLLGALRSTVAVRPLLEAVLSPLKSEVGGAAARALLAIGKPAVAPAIALLRSEDAELVRYAEAETRRAPRDLVAFSRGGAPSHVVSAAFLLASIGRQEALDPLLAALRRSDPLSRALLARELSKLPATPESVRAFQETYEKTPMGLDFSFSGNPARQDLLDTAVAFSDANLVPWLVKMGFAARGDAAEVSRMQEATLLAAAKLMKPPQIREVDRLYHLHAGGGRITAVVKKDYAGAKALLARCGERLECYLDAVVEPPATEGSDFVAVKAATMVGVYGSPAARGRMREQLPNIESRAARLAMAHALERHAPKGDEEAAQALLLIAGESGNRVDAADQDIAEIARRLRARAE